ncbi:MAG TPA: hypothetical protein DEF00_01215 [Candidatus Taylorbacteria bacterium]|nr:MAG: hypothetical protein UY03_C0024G0015 [Parcubacteria group bacterium GW2011_GWA2_47_64]KKU97016.1 MAG: hypothetical protein UY29_C0003G0013 [Parcubacteria group bacterium GW2011_GWC2_48_17]HBV00998.1 hypothetical protein [Candidatus Taylorbacteria bacterium]
MKTRENMKVIYPITIGDLQNDALKRIGRKLNDDELYTAEKCVESGLSFVMDITLKSAIEEAIDKNN